MYVLFPFTYLPFLHINSHPQLFCSLFMLSLIFDFWSTSSPKYINVSSLYVFSPSPIFFHNSVKLNLLISHSQTIP